MKGLRIFLFIFLLLILFICILVEFPSQKEEKSLHDQIADSLLHSKFEKYINPEFEFYSYYSKAMDVEPDSINGYNNYIKASLWIKDVHIVHESYATINEPYWIGDSMVISLPQRYNTSYISSNSETLNDTIRVDIDYPLEKEEFKGYKYYAKYVRNGKMWFVQSLIYPCEYEDAVEPIRKLIEKWKVW